MPPPPLAPPVAQDGITGLAKLVVEGHGRVVAPRVVQVHRRPLNEPRCKQKKDKIEFERKKRKLQQVEEEEQREKRKRQMETENAMLPTWC